jgi:hypothetical protein
MPYQFPEDTPSVWVIHDTGAFAYAPSDFRSIMESSLFFSSPERGEGWLAETAAKMEEMAKDEPDRYWARLVNPRLLQYRSGYDQVKKGEFGTHFAMLVEVKLDPMPVAVEQEYIIREGFCIAKPRIQVRGRDDWPDPRVNVALCVRSSEWRSHPNWGSEALYDSITGSQFSQKRIILLLDDNVGEDMSWAVRVFDGIDHLSPANDVEAIVARFWLVWHGYKGDNISGDPGAVSCAEFEEHLRQAALPSSDPDKRD